MEFDQVRVRESPEQSFGGILSLPAIGQGTKKTCLKTKRNKCMSVCMCVHMCAVF